MLEEACFVFTCSIKHVRYMYMYKKCKQETVVLAKVTDSTIIIQGCAQSSVYKSSNVYGMETNHSH